MINAVAFDTLIKQNVPRELLIRPQWVAWKAVPKSDGKTDKIPINPHNGGNAASDDLLTWSTLDKALNAVKVYRLAGVGFMFCSGDRYVGIDFDHVEGMSGDVEALSSYTELSPSGKGYHVIAKGKLPESIKRDEIEMYSEGRFFTVTGQHVEGTPKTIEPRNNEIIKIYRRYKPEKTAEKAPPAVRPLVYIDDYALLNKAFNAKNGDKVKRLWEGDTSMHGGNDSVADAALCSELAFYTGPDPDHLERLFGLSQLGQRDKWKDRPDYRASTIDLALKDRTDYYDWTPAIPLNLKKNGTSNSTIADFTLNDETLENPLRRPYTLHYAYEALEAQPPISWVVDALFSRGSVNIVVGPPGTKKTWSILDLAVCIAIGEQWLDRVVDQGPVLLVDEESGERRLKRRLGQVMRGHSAGADTMIAYTCLEMFNMLDNGDVGAIDEIMTQVHPAVMVIDALADVMPGGDENAVKDTHPVFQRLRALAEKHQCAIIVIHHANKIGGYRGSTAIAGAVDLMLMVDSEKDSANITFVTAKARDTEPQTFGAKINFDLTNDLTEGPVRLTSSEAIVVSKQRNASEKYVLWYLEKCGGEASLVDIASHSDSCSEASARKAVWKLTGEGVLRRCDSGKAGEKAIYKLVGHDEKKEEPGKPVPTYYQNRME